MSSNRIGQIFTTDFVISIFLFLVLVNASYLLWIEAHNQQTGLSEERLLQQQSHHSASILARTPGYPANWTVDDVKIIGLAEPDHVLQEQKMIQLNDMSTDEIRQGLGYSSETNFVINVTNETGTMQAEGNEFVWGTPPTDADDIATAERPVLVNATNLYQRGTLHILLWR